MLALLLAGLLGVAACAGDDAADRSADRGSGTSVPHDLADDLAAGPSGAVGSSFGVTPTTPAPTTTLGPPPALPPITPAVPGPPAGDLARPRRGRPPWP